LAGTHSSRSILGSWRCRSRRSCCCADASAGEVPARRSRRARVGLAAPSGLAARGLLAQAAAVLRDRLDLLGGELVLEGLHLGAGLAVGDDVLDLGQRPLALPAGLGPVLDLVLLAELGVGVAAGPVAALALGAVERLGVDLGGGLGLLAVGLLAVRLLAVRLLAVGLLAAVLVLVGLGLVGPVGCGFLAAVGCGVLAVGRCLAVGRRVTIGGSLAVRRSGLAVGRGRVVRRLGVVGLGLVGLHVVGLGFVGLGLGLLVVCLGVVL